MSLDPKGLAAAVAAVEQKIDTHPMVDAPQSQIRRIRSEWCARAAITAYRASIQAEPVAWQHKSESGVWHHHDEDEHEEFARLGFQVRCLYTSPVPSSPVSVEKVLEVLEPFAKVIDTAEKGGSYFGVDHSEEVPDARTYGVLGVTWGHLRAARDLHATLKGRG